MAETNIDILEVKSGLNYVLAQTVNYSKPKDSIVKPNYITTQYQPVIKGSVEYPTMPKGAYEGVIVQAIQELNTEFELHKTADTTAELSNRISAVETMLSSILNRLSALENV
jgi:hypothetical protein